MRISTALTEVLRRIERLLGASRGHGGLNIGTAVSSTTLDAADKARAAATTLGSEDSDIGQRLHALSAQSFIAAWRPPHATWVRSAPDPDTLEQARVLVAEKMRQRFGDVEPTPIQLEDMYQENISLLEQYVHVDKGIERLANDLERPVDDVRAQMREELRGLVQDKPIAIRIHADALTCVLEEGRYRSRRRAGGERSLAECEWFGTDPCIRLRCRRWNSPHRVPSWRHHRDRRLGSVGSRADRVET
ncbi:hypothetical protein [Nocardia brasiliensis]|uniref:hypothetical protein n=1 Tax=Nocardia brasiliensis TaxID=37326 RepID=UPI002457198F|nr:hypothetical protein [Nocardia brasiliensis]